MKGITLAAAALMLAGCSAAAPNASDTTAAPSTTATTTARPKASATIEGSPSRATWAPGALPAAARKDQVVVDNTDTIPTVLRDVPGLSAVFSSGTGTPIYWYSKQTGVVYYAPTSNLPCTEQLNNIKGNIAGGMTGSPPPDLPADGQPWQFECRSQTYK